MRVTPLADVVRRPRRVAVGVFDGVHRGHRRVIEGADTVLTFDPHPQTVVAPGTGPSLLTTLERKAELVESLGVEELVVIPFDSEFAARSAESFVDDVIVDALAATHVSVGENFRFGKHAEGNVERLAADDRFETRVLALLEYDDEIVSSAHIRGLIEGGAIQYAGELLEARFVIDGEVVHGDKRGRTLGFPTANVLPVQGYVLPAYGVYACRVRVGDDWHPAATNIGVRPQFQTGRGVLIEPYLIDWSGDIYGETVRIEFVTRLRGEKRFESVEALVEQIERDVVDARQAAGC